MITIENHSLDINGKYFFRDKSDSPCYDDGLTYFAAGLVDSFYLNADGKGSPSGKDICVLYIDPWGVVNHEWRERDKIHLILAKLEHYEHLKAKIEGVDAK